MKQRIDKYQVLMQHQEELQVLFEKIGYEGKNVRLKTDNSRIMKIIGEEVPFKYVDKYMDELMTQIRACCDYYEDKRLDQYSKIEEKQQIAQDNIDALNEQIAKLQEQSVILNDQNAKLCEQNENLAKENSQLIAKNQTMSEAYKKLEQKGFTIINELIELSDSLELRQDSIETADCDMEDISFKKIALQTTDRTNKNIKKILDLSGVSEICDEGHVDVTRHSIISTIATDDVNLDDTIAKTVSSGYIYNEKHLRNQQVIIYKLEK